eukprot:scaffold1467_cov264-Pinguiococcus_pyrenoidosus.AAC.11
MARREPSGTEYLGHVPEASLPGTILASACLAGAWHHSPYHRSSCPSSRATQEELKAACPKSRLSPDWEYAIGQLPSR